MFYTVNFLTDLLINYQKNLLLRYLVMRNNDKLTKGINTQEYLMVVFRQNRAYCQAKK